MHIRLLLFAATVRSRPLVRTDLSVIMARQPMTILVLCLSEFQWQGLEVYYHLPVYFIGIDPEDNTTYLCSISVALPRRTIPPTYVVYSARKDSYSSYLVVYGCTNIHVHISCSYISYSSIL